MNNFFFSPINRKLIETIFSYLQEKEIIGMFETIPTIRSIIFEKETFAFLDDLLRNSEYSFIFHVSVNKMNLLGNILKDFGDLTKREQIIYFILKNKHSEKIKFSKQKISQNCMYLFLINISTNPLIERIKVSKSVQNFIQKEWNITLKYIKSIIINKCDLVQGIKFSQFFGYFNPNSIISLSFNNSFAADNIEAIIKFNKACLSLQSLILRNSILVKYYVSFLIDLIKSNPFLTELIIFQIQHFYCQC